MGEGMDGWPLSWRREGRAGWREVVLETEEKKRGDINLTEARPACLSLPVSLSLKTHTYARTWRHACANLFSCFGRAQGTKSGERLARVTIVEVRKITLMQLCQQETVKNWHLFHTIPYSIFQVLLEQHYLVGGGHRDERLTMA